MRESATEVPLVELRGVTKTYREGGASAWFSAAWTRSIRAESSAS